MSMFYKVRALQEFAFELEQSNYYLFCPSFSVLCRKCQPSALSGCELALNSTGHIILVPQVAVNLNFRDCM